MTTYHRISRRLHSIACGLCAVCSLALQVPATAQEVPVVPNSIIVVFNNQTLPADAAARVQRAGWPRWITLACWWRALVMRTPLG